KIAFKNLGEMGSSQRFRDVTIEDQLKKRYVKDQLLIVDILRVQCVDTAAGNTVGHLIDMVLRRNVHVHNLGTVDARYSEREPERCECSLHALLLTLLTRSSRA